MAALLAIFRPVPPLIRTRAKELLETIRATVKEHMLASNVASVSQAAESTPEIVAPDTGTIVAAVSSSTPTVNAHKESVDLTRLWSNQRTSELAIIFSLVDYLT